MVLITEKSTTSHRVRPTVQRRRLSNAVVAIITFSGILIASYPSISQWATAHQRSDAITGYSESVERAAPAVLHEILENGRQYNSGMPGVLVTDPYALEDARAGNGGAWEKYLQALAIPGSDVMATIRIPTIDVNLPVKHGTSDAVLAEGAGHLFGSSLPVGGHRTHSVITAHTALSRAKLFDDLNQVKFGDIFHIDVAGETLTYRVESIDVVLPHEVESLRLESGRDLVTLVTCAPRTVNTHRLLVRGERIETVPDASAEGQLVNTRGAHAAFPWWTLWVGGAAATLAAFTIRGQKVTTPRTETETVTEDEPIDP